MDPLTLLIVAAVFLVPLVWYFFSQREDSGGGYSLPPLPQPGTSYEEEREREVSSLGGLATSQDEQEQPAPWEGPPLAGDEIGAHHPLEGPPERTISQRVAPPTATAPRLRGRRARRAVRTLLRSRAGLRQAILVQAIIGPPKSLASDDDGPMG
jgi:hypothetical protein